MKVIVEFLDGTEEIHETIKDVGPAANTTFIWLVHYDGSETYVNLDVVRTIEVDGRAHMYGDPAV